MAGPSTARATWLALGLPQENALRRYATYLPANFIFGLALLGITYQVVEPIRFINPLIMLVILAYPTIVASKKFTDAFFYQVSGGRRRHNVGVMIAMK